MKVCIDCDEEIVEEKYDDHKKCTKALISEYEDKIREMEKAHKLEIEKMIRKTENHRREINNMRRRLDDFYYSRCIG